jgi:hypothetical protein
VSNRRGGIGWERLRRAVEGALISVLVLAALLSCKRWFPPKREPAAHVARVKIAGKWGYIDGNGTPLFAPTFDYVADFEEGLAGARLGEEASGLWGWIDARGGWAIPARFPKTRPFSEGLAAAVDPVTLLYGFVDRTGSFKIAPRFEMTLSFSEGLAAAKEPDKAWGYIDKSGSFVIAPRFRDAERHYEGLAAVHDGGWTFVDRSGKQAFNATFTDAGRFSEGRAAVWVAVGGRLGTAVQRYCYYIGRDGASPGIFNDRADKCGSFKNGLAPAAQRDENRLLWGFMNPRGDFAIKPEFRNVRKCNEGYCAVQDDKSGAWGFIDLKGKYVLEPRYENADDFVDGIAPVKQSGRWGYIDTRGKTVLEFRYDDALPLLPRKSAGL